MLTTLKFVQGAVASKDLVPALTHFRIVNNTIRSFNGILAINSPIDLDIDCTPKAVPLVKAIQNCTTTVEMKMTPKGRLSIKSGKFKALIDCLEIETPHVEAEGDEIEIDGGALYTALKMVSPFISTDAAKPWSHGILLSNQSAYSTNNIIFVQHWIGTVFPKPINLPREAVKEILRVGEPPIGARLGEKSITFLYPEGRWIRTQLIQQPWPDVFHVLDCPEANMQPIDKELFEALDHIKPFINKSEHVYFLDGTICTSVNPEEGASFEMTNFNYPGAYQWSFLNMLKNKVEKIDFTQYPKKCPFEGGMIRGVIIGLRV